MIATNPSAAVALERQPPPDLPTLIRRSTASGSQRSALNELLADRFKSTRFTPTQGEFRERSPFDLQIGWWGEIRDLLGLNKKDARSPRTIKDLLKEGHPLVGIPSFRTQPSEDRELSRRSSRLDQTLGSAIVERVTKGTALYRYDVPIKNLPPELEGLSILHLSDIHFHRQRLERIKEMRALAAHLELRNDRVDITAITGDLITDNSNDLNALALRTLNRLAPDSVRLFTRGNHDYYEQSAAYLDRALTELGFHDVTSKPVRIIVQGKPLNIYGIDDFLEGTPAAPVVAPNHEDETNLLFTHNLDAVRSNCPDVFDVILSGHLHAGEVNFGLLNGVDIMRMFGYAQNINQQRVGWDTLTERALSFISPGHVRHWFHFNVEQRGAALMRLTRSLSDDN